MMHPVLKEHFDAALEIYSRDKFYPMLLEARQSYFEMTGQVLEEDDDYEARMSAFNHWFLLEYRHPSWLNTPMELYLEDRELDHHLAEAIRSVTHSLFEYIGKNMRRHDVLYDILRDKKIILAKDFDAPSLLKHDIFLGRVALYEDKYFLLGGLRFLPSETKPILKKQAKRVRKSELPNQESEFLKQVEFLKSKWRRYGHLNAKQIFDFNSFGAKAP